REHGNNLTDHKSLVPDPPQKNWRVFSSSFREGYVNTRTTNRKLKSKTCLRSESEPFYRLKIREKGTNLAQEFGISKQQISKQDPKIY
ncbi:unnamed protein product, partial [Pocillopora meandrina]